MGRTACRVGLLYYEVRRQYGQGDACRLIDVFDSYSTVRVGIKAVKTTGLEAT